MLFNTKSVTSAVMLLATAAVLLIATTDAFTVAPSSLSSLSSSLESSHASSSQLEMGLFDFFNDDARKEREEKKRRLVEEQERLQKAIMERRRNPELMEEYEQKVAVRRQLKMKGDFDSAKKIDQYEDVDRLTLLDGTEGSS